MERRSSSAVRRLARAHAAALLIAIGCAHAEAPPPVAPSAPAPAPAPAPGAPADTVAPEPGPEGRLDPSEEITPEELATIPEPVPRPAAREDAAREPAPPPSMKPPSSGVSTDSRWVWRVQVFASPDRDQAERVAHEASSRLEEPHVLEREDSLYKVRLGSFASEAEAQELRDRAVRAGFSGAFRVRSYGSISD